jgi:hypothetical protein
MHGIICGKDGGLFLPHGTDALQDKCPVSRQHVVPEEVASPDTALWETC